MSQDTDYGYSSVQWEEMTSDNLKLAEAEYRERLEGTLSDAEYIDKKAQFVLTGLIGLVTALLGLAFSQSKNLDAQYLIGLYSLAAIFWLGAIFATLSVFPRTYAHLGVTPKDLNIEKWLPLLKGDEKDARRLSGVRIKEYAQAITEHDQANSQKSRWLKRSLVASVAASPLAGLLVVVSTTTMSILGHSPQPAIVAPVGAPITVAQIAVTTPIAATIIVVALLLGGTAGVLLRRFIVGRH